MVSLVAGALLGCRFKISALAPASAIALILVIAAGATRGDDTWWIVVSAAAVVTSLQIGYFSGLFLESLWMRDRQSAGHHPREFTRQV
jgi:hypothetical protein